MRSLQLEGKYMSDIEIKKELKAVGFQLLLDLDLR